MAEAEMEVLQRGLRRHLARNAQIVDVRSVALDTYSTHPIRRLRVKLDDGTHLAVIFKRLRADGQRCAAREVRLYERWLRGRRYGAPALYASCSEETEDRHWLFIEDVGDWRLDWCDTPVWHQAFRWLARMHADGYGSEPELLALGCLAEHNRAFSDRLAASARQQVVVRAPWALTRFDAAMTAYEQAVEASEAQPRTLVHGDLSCKNVIVQCADGNTRFRPVDWEWAAVGLPTWDVAKLLSGWGTQRKRLLATYLSELRRHVDLDPRGFARSLAVCEAGKLLWYLRWWVAGCDDPGYLRGLLDKLEQRVGQATARG
jgi:hypothetical protein